MEGKKSFILYSDLLGIVNQLPDEQAGKLFKIILEYVNDKEVDIDDLLLKIAFEPIRQQLKRDLEKWEGIKEKRKEAGKKGGRPKKEVQLEEKEENQTEAKKANGFFEKQTKSKKAVTVNDNVTVTVNVNDNDILLEKETKVREVWNIFSGKKNLFEKDLDKFIKKTEGLEIDFEKLKISAKNTKDVYFQTWLNQQFPKKTIFKPPSLQQVQEYCNERNNGISAYSFVNFYQSKGWMVGVNKMKDWKAAVRTWEQKRKEENEKRNNTASGGSSSGKGRRIAQCDPEELAKLIARDSEMGNLL